MYGSTAVSCRYMAPSKGPVGGIPRVQRSSQPHLHSHSVRTPAGDFVQLDLFERSISHLPNIAPTLARLHPSMRKDVPRL